MTLNVDPTRAIHRPADLLALVRVVVNANPEDETDWVEWKRTLDLGGRPGQFTLARVILGFANRYPAHAARYVGGHGYVIVGAEPGRVEGVERLDEAVLDQRLRRYLGDNGPQWAPHHLDVDGHNVLVVKVEPPAEGDPIFPLRHAGTDDKDKASPDGTIFVRRGTRTEPASAADIDRLMARLLADRPRPTDGPSIDLAFTGEAIVADRTLIQAAVDAQVVAEAERMIAVGEDELPAEAEWNLGAPSPVLRTPSPFAGLLQPLSGWDDWHASVDEWQVGVSREAWDSAAHLLTENGLGKVEVEVRSATDDNLKDVKVIAHLPADFSLIAYDEDGAPEPTVPKRPRPFKFGYSGSFLSDLSGRTSAPLGINPVAHFPSNVTVDGHADGSTDIHFWVGDLRPREAVTVEPAYLLLLSDSGAQTVPIRWQATSKDVSGVRSGNAEVPIGGLADPGKAYQALAERICR